MNITFEKANPAHKDIILGWLNEPHVQEFWDDAPEHKADIVIFTEGRQVPSPYFNGVSVYWVGFVNNDPYCFIVTHEEGDAPTLEYYRPHISKTGKTFGLDFFIGNKNYFGKGLAVPTLQAFMDFFAGNIEPETDLFLIDPHLDNPRAIHVYEKAGFTAKGEFIREGEKGVLMVKKT
jgi:RimJ/RimL family protein N-acetyltransferase